MTRHIASLLVVGLLLTTVPVPRAQAGGEDMAWPLVTDVLKVGTLVLKPEWKPIPFRGSGIPYADVGLDNSVHLAYGSKYERWKGVERVDQSYLPGSARGLRVDLGGNYGGANNNGVQNLDAGDNVHIVTSYWGTAYYARHNGFHWSSPVYVGGGGNHVTLAMGPHATVFNSGGSSHYAHFLLPCTEDHLGTFGLNPDNHFHTSRLGWSTQCALTYGADNNPRDVEGTWAHSGWRAGGETVADGNLYGVASAARTGGTTLGVTQWTTAGHHREQADRSGISPESFAVPVDSSLSDGDGIGAFDVAMGPSIVPILDFGDSSVAQAAPVLVAYANGAGQLMTASCSGVDCIRSPVGQDTNYPHHPRGRVTEVAVDVDNLGYPWIAYVDYQSGTYRLHVGQYNGYAWQWWPVESSSQAISGLSMGMGPYHDKIPVLAYQVGSTGRVMVPRLVEEIPLPHAEIPLGPCEPYGYNTCIPCGVEGGCPVVREALDAYWDAWCLAWGLTPVLRCV